jgi:hypothetical protein
MESVVSGKTQHGANVVQNDTEICVKFIAILGFKVHSKNALPFDCYNNQNRSLRMWQHIHYRIG